MMKNLKWLGKIWFILFVFLLNFCSKEEPINKGIEGNWTVVSFEDFETSTSITKTDENSWMDHNNGNITVNFSLSDNFKGTLSGKNVTNTYSGDFTIGPAQQLTILSLNGTEINVPEWGRMFYSIMLAESYEINGNLLTIFYDNRKKGTVLKRS